MKKRFSVKVGLSDHTLGSDVAIASVALGAEVVEKHFMLDKKIDSPDKAFSMDFNEFKKMVNSIHNVELALGNVYYPNDKNNIKGRNMCRSLYIVEDMKKNDIISENNIRSIRPGYGLLPCYLEEIIGKKVNRDLHKGDRFSLDYVTTNCNFD